MGGPFQNDDRVIFTPAGFSCGFLCIFFDRHQPKNTARSFIYQPDLKSPSMRLARNHTQISGNTNRAHAVSSRDFGLELLTFNLENSRFGVWGPRRLLCGFQFSSPLSEDSRMGRRCRVFLSDTGPLRLIDGSLTFP